MTETHQQFPSLYLNQWYKSRIVQTLNNITEAKIYSVLLKVETVHI